MQANENSQHCRRQPVGTDLNCPSPIVNSFLAFGREMRFKGAFI